MKIKDISDSIRNISIQGKIVDMNAFMILLDDGSGKIFVRYRSRDLADPLASSFQDMAKRHMMTAAKYPHFKLGKGRPYEGIENLRPESKEVVETFMSWQPNK